MTLTREEKIEKYRINRNKNIEVCVDSQKEWKENEYGSLCCDAKWLCYFIDKFVNGNKDAEKVYFIVSEDDYHNEMANVKLVAYNVKKTDVEIDEEIKKHDGYEEANERRKAQKAKSREDREKEKREREYDTYLKLKSKFEKI